MPPVPRPQSFLAFDYGLRRVGVATGNSLLKQAQALRTVAAVGEARMLAIGRLVAEWQPDALVVGVPFHPDGAPHENTARAQRFARQLQGRFCLPVHQVDERYSTTEAQAAGARDLDAAAAAIILQQFLRALPDDADPSLHGALAQAVGTVGAVGAVGTVATTDPGRTVRTVRTVAEAQLANTAGLAADAGAVEKARG